VAAREIQKERFTKLANDPAILNATCNAALLQEIIHPSKEGKALLQDAAAKLQLSARGFHKALRVARTLADLEGEREVARSHIAEALSYRGEAQQNRTSNQPTVNPQQNALKY
jgi:magnesium chelatase family protein